MTWETAVPSKAGEYIVQTKSTIFKTIKTLDAKLSFNKKKPMWSFNNQTFYRYLKQ